MTEYLDNMAKALKYAERLQAQADLETVRRAFPKIPLPLSERKIPRRQRNAARWEQHRDKMAHKDKMRFGLWLYRPHPWHFRKKAKSPGARENARGERIWAEAMGQLRRNHHPIEFDLAFPAILARVAGMGVKL